MTTPSRHGTGDRIRSTRLPLLLAALAVLSLSACTSGDAPGDAPSTTGTEATTTSVPPSATLRYGYSAGDSLTYALEVHQDIGFSADGDTGGFGTDLPIDAALTSESASTMEYRFDDADGTDHIAVSVTGSFPDTRVSGTVNGEPVDDSGGDAGIAGELAMIDPIDTGFVVDRLGNVVSMQDAPPAIVGAELATLTGIADQILAQPLGPVFPVRSVSPGDSWETSGPGVGRAGDATSTSRIEAVDGDVWTVTTETDSAPYDIDLSDQFRTLYRDLAGVEPGAEPSERVRQALDRIDFTIQVSRSHSTSTVEFDAVGGIPYSKVQTTDLTVQMVFRYPDASGEITGIDLTLTLSQTATFDLRP